MGSKKKRIVSVFGSGHMEENFSEYQKASLLGRMLAENGFTVCTGGYGGIMEAAPRGAKQVGGKTMAVIAEELNPEPNRWIDDVKCEKTWKRRLMRLIDVADAFVVFDGGTGTMNELFVVWEMLNKKLIAKPMIIHGAEMIKFVRRVKKQSLVLFNENIYFSNTPQSVIDHIEDSLEEAEAEDD